MNIEFNKTQKKLEFLSNLISELDSLYDDLDYSPTESERDIIKAKISLRQQIIDKVQ
jgi:hypothetical protein